jgi:hypothetical protein
MEKPVSPFTLLCQAFVGVAAIACTASVIIAWLSFGNLRTVTDWVIIAIALMVAAPAGLGTACAWFLYLAFRAEIKKTAFPVEDKTSEQFFRGSPRSEA